MLPSLLGCRSGRFARGYRERGRICGNSSTAADMNGKMSRLLEEHEMPDLLDLIAAPAERDLPPGHLEERKQMLLHAITAPEAGAGADQPLRSRLRRIAGWLAAFVAVVVVGLGASRAEFQAVN